MTAGAALAKAPAKPEAGGALTAPPSLEPGLDEGWGRVLGLGCDLTVDLPMPHFKISDLLQLRPGSVIDARWKVGRDVPLLLNGTAIASVEFDVVASHLAVRLTELA
jgi:flagellar motor switch/type III secretory pathway protein FliN